jgi:pimeloyl-ACP methyl ester carboxylesterase
LAQAAYASLSGSNPAIIDALQEPDGGFTATQAQTFASKQSVVLQYNDDASILVGNGTSLSVTVFKDVGTNALTLAIRGTQQPEDWDTANNSIVLGGAGYPQIAALYNWWLRATMPAGSMVEQFAVYATDQGDPTALALTGGGYLVHKADVAATGELVGVLSADADGKVDVTGHSLGGHLAMAFGAMFDSATASVTAFNAPGFKDTTTNGQFFDRLGSSLLPSGAKTINVIADAVRAEDVSPSPIAGLWSRPGTPFDIPIEDQWLGDEPIPAGARNHSQVVLTDALAVYSLLDRLQPGLATAMLDSLLGTGSNRESGGLEGIVGSLRSLLGIGSTALPVGHANRESLHEAVKAISDNSFFQALAGKVTVRSASTLELSTLGQTDFAAVASLLTLSPIVLQGNGDEGKSALESLWQSAAWTSAYQNWLGDFALRQAGQEAVHYTQSWLEDRGLLLATIARRNANDSTNPNVGDNSLPTDRVIDMRYLEPGSGAAQTLTAWNPSNNPLGNALTTRPHQLVVFGGDAAESIDGLAEARLGDHLYGGNGNDVLNGLAGADRLEGNAGNDILDGGTGNDTLLGGKDSDTCRFTAGWGADTIEDSDGAGAIVVQGLGPLNGLGARKVAPDVWQTADRRVNYSLIDVAGSRSNLLSPARQHVSATLNDR